MRYREHRILCDFETRVLTAAGQTGCVIRNVSPLGARLQGVSDICPGDRVAVDLRLTQPKARVVWRREDLAGLRFDRPLSPKEISLVRGSHQKSQMTRNTAGYQRFREL